MRSDSWILWNVRSADREVIGILESLHVRMLEDRPQGDRRPAAYLLGPVAAAQDGEERVDQFVVDDREVPGKLGGQQEIGL